MRIAGVIAAGAFALGILAGCGSAPPAPTDRFYRLQVAPTGSTGPGIDVRQVRAESLYAERPIVFVRADDPRQLRQYHYHLWLYPPAQTVRDQLRASLGTGTGTGKATMALDARITAFERVLDGAGSRAQLAIEVTVSGEKGVLLEKRYQASQAAGDDSFSAFAAAMEAALKQVSAEIRQDTAALR